MKTTLKLLAAIAALTLAGCSSIPNGEFTSWTHDGNYAVFATHYEAHNAVKQADGKVMIGAYTGSIKVMGGYGPSDTITNLVVDPKVVPTAVQVLPAPTK